MRNKLNKFLLRPDDPPAGGAATEDPPAPDPSARDWDLNPATQDELDEMAVTYLKNRGKFPAPEAAKPDPDKPKPGMDEWEEKLSMSMAEKYDVRDNLIDKVKSQVKDLPDEVVEDLKKRLSPAKNTLEQLRNMEVNVDTVVTFAKGRKAEFIERNGEGTPAPTTRKPTGGTVGAKPKLSVEMQKHAAGLAKAMGRPVEEIAKGLEEKSA